jgi:hypothetical protein
MTCAQNPECLRNKSSEGHFYVLLLTIQIPHVNEGKFLNKVHIL